MNSGSFGNFSFDNSAVHDLVLSSFSHVIQHVLCYLSLNDLWRCQRVSREWKFCSEKVLRDRKKFAQWVLIKKPKERQNSTALVITTIDAAATFFQSGLRSNPELAFLFCKLRPQTALIDFIAIKDKLPPATRVVGCVAAAGVIGTQHGCFDIKEYEKPTTDTVASLLLPKWERLGVYQFLLTKDDLRHLPDPEVAAYDPETFTRILNIPYDKTVKCLILICPAYIPFEYCEYLFHTLWLKQRGDVAFAGGVANDVKVLVGNGATSSEELGVLGIAFCGDSVKAASVVIPEACSDIEGIRGYLNKLKATNVHTHQHSFAFMFACNGRGKYMHHRENVESSLFREAFPRTPLIGIFSMGECGLEYLPGVTGSRHSQAAANNNAPEIVTGRSPPPPDVLHGYATCIGLLSVDENV